MGPDAVTWAEPWAIVVAPIPDGTRQAPPVRLVFEGARPGILPEGEEVLPGAYNYFRGNDPERWTTGARSYRGVRYRDLYPGIDLVLHGSRGRLKYDVIAAPGADVQEFVVRCTGVDALTVDQDGDLVLDTPMGKWLQGVGAAWQVSTEGTRVPVLAEYTLLGTDRFGIKVPDRDPALPLVIDPELAWATYVGSSGGGVGDFVYAVAVEANGDVTAVGKGNNINFPVTQGSYQNPGPFMGNDAFVTRLSAKDGSLIYSSVIGGAGEDRALGVAVDSSGRATVVGWTNAFDFPTTPGAFDTTKGVPNSSAFVFRLSPAGDTLEYSSYLEGTTNGAEAVAVDVLDSGQAFVGGEAYSNDFPVTPGAFQTAHAPLSSYDGFVAKVSTDGSTLDWASFIGGAGADHVFALAVSQNGEPTIVGHTQSSKFPITPGAYKTGSPDGGDAFCSRFAADGSSLLWSTFLGGSDEDKAYAIALEDSGSVVVGGSTSSADFPTTPGAFQSQLTPPQFPHDTDGFVTHLDASGSSLLSSTYFGGPLDQFLDGVAVDASGVVTVAGTTLGGTVPTTPGSFDPVGPGNTECFISRFDPTGTRLFYSTYVGGPSTDDAKCLAVSPVGRATVGGYCYLGGFPTTPGSFSPKYNGGQLDGIVASLDLQLQGVMRTHHSVPSCLGPIMLNATEMPVAGSASFGFYGSGAPPLASGWLVVTGAGNLDDVSVTPSGRQLLSVPKSSKAIPVVADATGYLETPFSLASFWAGRRFRCRYFFANTATCGGLGTWSASNELLVRVQ